MVNLDDLVNDQGELALSIALDEKGNPVQVCRYGNPQRGNEFTSEEKRDLFLAASLNKEKTHDDDRLVFVPGLKSFDLALPASI